MQANTEIADIVTMAIAHTAATATAAVAAVVQEKAAVTEAQVISKAIVEAKDMMEKAKKEKEKQQQAEDRRLKDQLEQLVTSEAAQESPKTPSVQPVDASTSPLCLSS